MMYIQIIFKPRCFVDKQFAFKSLFTFRNCSSVSNFTHRPPVYVKMNILTCVKIYISMYSCSSKCSNECSHQNILNWIDLFHMESRLNYKIIVHFRWMSLKNANVNRLRSPLNEQCRGENNILNISEHSFKLETPRSYIFSAIRYCTTSLCMHFFPFILNKSDSLKWQ